MSLRFLLLVNFFGLCLQKISLTLGNFHVDCEKCFWLWKISTTMKNSLTAENFFDCGKFTLLNAGKESLIIFKINTNTESRTETYFTCLLYSS